MLQASDHDRTTVPVARLRPNLAKWFGILGAICLLVSACAGPDELAGVEPSDSTVSTSSIRTTGQTIDTEQPEEDVASETETLEVAQTGASSDQTAKQKSANEQPAPPTESTPAANTGPTAGKAKPTAKEPAASSAKTSDTAKKAPPSTKAAAKGKTKKPSAAKVPVSPAPMSPTQKAPASATPIAKAPVAKSPTTAKSSKTAKATTATQAPTTTQATTTAKATMAAQATTTTKSSTTTAPPTTKQPTTTAKNTTTVKPTTAKPTTAAPKPTPSGRRTTGSVINPNDSSVRFFSDNDDCGGIQNSQRHPDWEGGQPNSSTNEDGAPTYGFAYNTGAITRGEISWGFVKSDIALSGDCVLSMGVNDAYNNTRAIRIFRRYDKNGNDLPKVGYYSVWFYFPQEVSFDNRSTVGGKTSYGFWNVFQMKNRVNGESLSSLSINAGKVTGDGSMNFSVYRKSECGAVEECSSSHSIEQANPIPIPVGRWVHLEMYLKSSTGSDGRVTLWQDGRQIIDFTGQTERHGSVRNNWSVNNYGQLFRPASHKLFVDDVLISTEPVHQKLFN